MNRTEKEILKTKEDSSYKFMRRCAQSFGRQSSEFNIARAEWMAYHSLCSLFDVDEVIMDGNK